ncbi:MAG TPA: folate-binding protein [Stellaceae bacterium]|nr:folate-binding protein [Stellaceae bacterium]
MTSTLSHLNYALPDPRRGILRVTGPDRRSFLQGLVSNDLDRLSPDRAIWAALLMPQGKFLHDFMIVEQGESLLLDAEGERLDDLKRRLSIYKLRSNVAIEAMPDRTSWVGWGPDATQRFGLTEPGQALHLDDATLFADPRRLDLGLRIIAPGEEAASLFEDRGFSGGHFAEWDRLRMSLGVPDGSRDMAIEKAILLENGFDELGGVAWDKGCYMGQELTARTKYRGLVKKRLMPVRIDGPALDPGTIIEGEDGSEAGEMRSARDGVGLALLRLDAIRSGETLKAGETALTPMPAGWMVLEPVKP